MAEDQAILGRDLELAEVEAFLDAPPSGPAALLVEGEPGIGKTTLWLAAVGRARDRGNHVLTAAPAKVEQALSFSALGDLLAGILDPLLARLPRPQRRALEVALLIDEGDGHPPDPRAVSLAFLAVVRLLMTSATLLLAIDDVQWLDSASATVLAFAARRLRYERVGFLLFARKMGDETHLAGLDRAIQDRRVRRMSLGPLSVGALGRLLRVRLEASFSRPDVTRIHELSGGNPFFALELARGLQDGTLHLDPGQPAFVDVDTLVGTRVAGLPRITREALAAAAACADPTLDIVEAVTGSPAEPALRPAIASDVIRLHGDRINFTHPLLGSAAYSAVSGRRRRALHAALAQTVQSQEERVRHLALSSELPDEAIAAAVEHAAEGVRTRGAPSMAAQMLEQASTITPIDAVDERSRRSILAAQYHREAGDMERARSLLEQAVSTAPVGRQRADALTHLAWASVHALGYRRAAELLEEASLEAGDDLEVLLSIERGMAWCTHQGGNLIAAEGHARAALEIAERLADPASLANALADVILIEFLMGRGVSDPEMARALALERAAATQLEILGRPSWINGMLLEWSGSLDAARAELEDLYGSAMEDGNASVLPYIANHLARIALRAGRLDEAVRRVAEAEDGALETGQGEERAYCLSTRALLDAHLGRVEDSRAAVQEGLRIAERTGSMVATFELLAAHGFLELSLGNPSAAMEPFGRLIRETPVAGFADPGLNMRFHPDAIEALVELGRLEEAEVLLSELAERGRRLDRAWALATSARGRGLLTAARGDSIRGLEALVEAVEAQRQVGEPFELARTLMTYGQIARRAKQKRLARESLDEAVRIFEEVRAPLWAAKARSELGRISGRAPSGDTLTAAERVLASLVAEGLSNRETAARLFVAEHTVEKALVRLYAKVGVTSRTGLIRRLSSRSAPD